MNTEILTVSQAAVYLKMSERTVRRYIENGSLRASKIGSRWKIRDCDIDTFLKDNANKDEAIADGQNRLEETTKIKTCDSKLYNATLAYEFLYRNTGDKEKAAKAFNAYLQNVRQTEEMAQEKELKTVKDEKPPIVM